ARHERTLLSSTGAVGKHECGVHGAVARSRIGKCARALSAGDVDRQSIRHRMFVSPWPRVDLREMKESTLILVVVLAALLKLVLVMSVAWMRRRRRREIPAAAPGQADGLHPKWLSAPRRI